MRRIVSFLILTILTVVIFNSFGYAQVTGVIGKLYTKSAADQTYGKVNSSVAVNTLTLIKAIKKSPDYLMFNIVNGNLIILNGKRAILYSTNLATTSVASNVVFHVFSTSKIKDVINLGGNNPFTSVELREDSTLTLTNGLETLEGGLWCPPYCP